MLTLTAFRIAEAASWLVRVSPKGDLLTANHIVADAKSITVRLSDGSVVAAHVKAASPNNDVALLSIAAATEHYLPFAEARSISIGEAVFTLGFPVPQMLGTEPRYTSGSVSALSGPGGEASFLQVSVPVQPGNSGGPLVNDLGQVIGIVTSSAAILPFLKVAGTLPQNLNFAVKAEYAVPLLELHAGPAPLISRAGAIALTQKAVCSVEAAR